MKPQVGDALFVVNNVTAARRIAFNIIKQITFSNFSKPDAWMRFVTATNGDHVVIVVVVVKLEG